MPDHRRHRGPHPEDVRLFAPAAHATLRAAVADLSWLLSRGYADPSALKLVGDRYGLDARQRSAVARSACTDERRDARAAKLLQPHAVAGRAVMIDGYNVLTTVEAALGGAVVLLARDGAVRDIASLHGTWRSVEETVPAAEFVGRTLADLGVSRAAWYLDSPVSNSGRLAAILRAVAGRNGWDWTVDLVQNPDTVLSAARGEAVATADSIILDRCDAWLNLAGEVVARHAPGANVVDLRDAT
ncbi:MAG TPA: DUF434 domain-containing protein [Humisphaera sp.]